MYVAYHFDADSDRFAGNYGDPILWRFFTELLSAPQTYLHVKVHVGDLLVHGAARGRAERAAVCGRVLADASAHWLTLAPAEFTEATAAGNTFVVAVEGMTASVNAHLHGGLSTMPEYYGALRLDPGSSVHWGLYSESLIPMFRYLNRSLRLFWSGLEGDGRDEGLAHRLEALGFENVEWEQTGLRYTIFDKYRSLEHARRTADLSDALVGHLAGLVDDVLLRLSDQAPDLRETLEALFGALDTADTPERLAHVALSCRRLLEGLADVLYPARDEEVDGRKVGQQQWCNRLWAYAKEQLEGGGDRAVLGCLEDVGQRVDRLSKAAHKGVHSRVSPVEGHRLAIGVFMLAHDLIVLTPPPPEVPSGPHEAELRRFLQDALAHRQSPAAGV